MKKLNLLILSLVFTASLYAQNVGINNETPSQTLDVNGKLKIGNDANTPEAGTMRFNNTTSEFEGYNGLTWVSLSNPPKTTKEITLTGVHFRPNRSADYISGINIGGAWIPSYSGGINLIAPLQLPVGSVIKKITFHFKDDSAAANANMSFNINYEYNNGFGFNTVLVNHFYTDDFGAPSNSIRTWSTNVNHTIGEDRGYYVKVYCNNWSSDLVVHGATIEYE